MNPAPNTYFGNGDDGFKQIVQLLLLLLLRVTCLLGLGVTNVMQRNLSSAQFFRFVILGVTDANMMTHLSSIYLLHILNILLHLLT
jgi:hypothetical protein